MKVGFARYSECTTLRMLTSARCRSRTPAVPCPWRTEIVDAPFPQILRLQLFLPSCVTEVMQPSDAKHYRAEARKCREAAVRAKDSVARLHWQQAERYWLTLANQAEVRVNLLAGRSNSQLRNGEWV
jgi:hypothetical protein